MPFKETVCGLPASASSAMDKVPVRLPDAVGVKVTLTVQFAPGAKEAGQLLVCGKSPDAEIEEIFKDAFPPFVSVTGWAALLVPTIWPAKVIDVVDSVATDAVPVPLRVKVGAAPGRLPFSARVPVKLPCAVGVKVTLTEQLAFIARLVPQVFV